MNYPSRDIPIAGAGLKTRFKVERARFFLRHFGNSLGISTNVLYWVHLYYCRLKTKFSEVGQTKVLAQMEAKQFSKALHKNGYVQLHPVNVDAMAAQLAEYFKNNPVKNGVGFVPKEEALKLAPELYGLLGQDTILAQTLREYYGSYFQCYWSIAWRCEVGADPKVNDAFTWHIDDNPKQVLKIFFYLNDTYESNAAFRAFDYATTAELIKKGFLSLSQEWRKFSQEFVTPALEKEKLRIMEGIKGTILLFDNNLVHKATSPRHGYRDLIVVEILPCEEPLNLDNLSNGLKTTITRDFPENPFLRNTR